MRGIFIILVVFLCNALSTYAYPNYLIRNEALGATTNPTGNPVGGGTGYSNIYTQGDFTVDTKSELLNALDQAESGQVVYIASAASIDLTGTTDIEIPPGVTLAGDRGASGSPGPLVFNDNMPEYGRIFLPKNNARITGIRIKGPDEDFDEITYQQSPFAVPPYDTPKSNAAAIVVRHAHHVEIDNCEISNFHRDGVNVQRGSRGTHIHHNFIHDVHAYPVVVSNQSEMPLLIEANIIHYIWHATAGSGDIGTGYEVRYNQIVRKASPSSWQPWYDGGHGIDMHADASIKSSRGQRIAGDVMKVHHNTFILDAAGDVSASGARDVKVRGVPRDLVEIYDNHFFNSNPSQAVVHYGGNTWVHDNTYGRARSAPSSVAMESTPQILFQMPPPPGESAPELPAQVAVDLDVNLYGQLTLSNVQILLNGSEIYNGPQVPAQGALMINFGDTDPSLAYQEMTVIATDDRGVTGTFMTVFNLSSLLPIVLSDFEGKLAQNKIALHWVTQSEIDADHFEIQKRMVGDKWRTLGRREARGREAQGERYEFVDHAPLYGDNVYRLRMVDQDGTFSFSPIEVVKFATGKGKFKIIPNPFSNEFNLQTEPDMEGFRFELFDAVGKLLRSGIIDRPNIRVLAQGLIDGPYYLQFSKNAIRYTARLMKM